MPATPPWLASAEVLLNRHLAASSQAVTLARRLQGTSLEIDVQGVTRIRVEAVADRLSVLSGGDSPADALITGSAPALLHMMRGGVSPSQSRSSVHIRGDAEIANLYRQLFTAARPDLEEELSRWIGDLPSRRVMQFAKGFSAWARRTQRTVGENIAEYLQEESRDLVNKPELEEFLHGVDEVREATDRIEARLGKLAARVKGGR